MPRMTEVWSARWECISSSERSRRRVMHAHRNNHKANEYQMRWRTDSPKWDVIEPWPLARGNAVTKSCTKKQPLFFNIISSITVQWEYNFHTAPPFISSLNCLDNNPRMRFFRFSDVISLELGVRGLQRYHHSFGEIRLGITSIISVNRSQW